MKDKLVQLLVNEVVLLENNIGLQKSSIELQEGQVASINHILAMLLNEEPGANEHAHVHLGMDIGEPAPVVETPLAVIETVEFDNTAPITHVAPEVTEQPITTASMNEPIAPAVSINPVESVTPVEEVAPVEESNFAFGNVDAIETESISDEIKSILNSTEVIPSVITITTITKKDFPTTIDHITELILAQDNMDTTDLKGFVMLFVASYVNHLQGQVQPAATPEQSAANEAAETINSEIAGIVG